MYWIIIKPKNKHSKPKWKQWKLRRRKKLNIIRKWINLKFLKLIKFDKF
jgi:hypothetical protein